MSAKSRSIHRTRAYINLIVLLLGTFFLVVALCGDQLSSLASGQSPEYTTKVSVSLRNAWNHDPDARIRYLAVLVEQADTSNSIADWSEQGWYVLNTLKKLADRTQAPLVTLLTGQQRVGAVGSFQAYYILNALEVYGNRASAEALVRAPQIRSIYEFPLVTFLGETSLAQDRAPTRTSSAGTPSDIEWNVELVRAPEAWAIDCDGTHRGCKGFGVTIGSIDTGVRYTHEALIGSYRGNLTECFFHDYNWWDPIEHNDVPVDPSLDGHGTMTLGVAVGDGGGNQIGVAPGAQWIASRGGWVDPGSTESGPSTGQIGGSAAPATQNLISAMQFMLAPTDLNGHNANSDARPRVVSNAWGTTGPYVACPWESISQDERDIRTMIINWVNDRIFPSFAAGNYGQPPYEGNDLPMAFPEIFKVGSLVQDTGRKATTSMIGPSCFPEGDPQYPSLMAGGQPVRSSSNGSDSDYRSLSGTSFPQPAVAGAVAIILQANPDLSVQQIKDILTDPQVAYWDNAQWGTRPNSEYGWGRLDVEAAVLRAMTLRQLPEQQSRISDQTLPAWECPTSTPTHTPTSTPTRTSTPTHTPSPTPCSTDCGRYADVSTTDTFFAYIRCVTCRGYLSGYPCGGAGEPCNYCSNPYYRPYVNMTRAQFAKLLSNAAGYSETPTGHRFADVPSDNPFYLWVERVASHGVMSGYPCGTIPSEPCDMWERPYFRPYADMTRAQAAKSVSTAMGWKETFTTQSFADVPTNHEFYLWIERVHYYGVMAGYPCGGPGEPCDPQNRPYFRPGYGATRGQAAKIIVLAFHPGGDECAVGGGGDGAPSRKPLGSGTATPGTPVITVTPIITGVPATAAPTESMQPATPLPTESAPPETPTAYIPSPVPSIPQPVPSVPPPVPSSAPTAIRP